MQCKYIIITSHHTLFSCNVTEIIEETRTITAGFWVNVIVMVISILC